MTLFRRALVHDPRADRSTPVAAVELTETDMRLIALACSTAGLEPPHGWRDSAPDFAALGNRLARVANELRKTANENGAAPADTGPRHDSNTEVPA